MESIDPRIPILIILLIFFVLYLKYRCDMTDREVIYRKLGVCLAEIEKSGNKYMQEYFTKKYRELASELPNNIKYGKLHELNETLRKLKIDLGEFGK